MKSSANSCMIREKKGGDEDEYYGLSRCDAGNDPKLQEAVEALGKWIGENGHDLIYGGSKCGLMGSIAESVLQNGGKVTGVEPQFFVDSELQHDGLTELIVTKDMTDRKTKMIELGDAFIAFPGARARWRKLRK